ncbi:unnamed protein product [Paramecium octaurelia]|uniref:FHA domain-containing protein n=1 Tax=Paramecium octaurelia TaxID=43137 RepID=A0A8S1UMJ6_PAROT|nr:unnamed protein product [Paramecium octaurelia]
MDSAFLFWEKYFNNQIEVSWDEFSESFSKFIQQFGSIIFDEDQLLYIKQIIDPDYRNVIKIGDYIIFYEIYWKIQSKRQALFKHQFTLQPFQIPKQTLRCIQLKVLYITNGYPDQFRDIQITRTTQNNLPLKQEEVFTIGSGQNCDLQILNDLKVNPIHAKLIWTPNNLFLIKDNSKSFRTCQRIKQSLILDAYMIIKLNQETIFQIKYIQPIPKFSSQISTNQESLKNSLPDLLKQLNQYKSVQDYRERKVNLIQHDEEPTLILEFIGGPMKGREFTLNPSQEYTLGCGKTCSISIRDGTLQKEHCSIKFKNNQWIIQPKESNHLDPTQFGTFVMLANQQQYDLYLPSRCHVLHEGMQIVIGPILFQIHYFS